RFINPGFQWSCQTDLPAGRAFRRHTDQTAPPRSRAPPTTLGTEDSDRVGPGANGLGRASSPIQRWRFRPGWHAFYLYLPTVYVTPRRPRKPPPWWRGLQAGSCSCLALPYLSPSLTSLLR